MHANVSRMAYAWSCKSLVDHRMQPETYMLMVPITVTHHTQLWPHPHLESLCAYSVRSVHLCLKYVRYSKFGITLICHVCFTSTSLHHYINKNNHKPNNICNLSCSNTDYEWKYLGEVIQLTSAWMSFATFVLWLTSFTLWYLISCGHNNSPWLMMNISPWWMNYNIWHVWMLACGLNWMK